MKRQIPSFILQRNYGIRITQKLFESKQGHKEGKSSKKYMETLLLPKTKFPMRPDVKNEDVWREKTTKSEFYRKQLKSNDKEKDTYIMHDGPPYANGNLHMGHALNKILKDVVNRYKLLQGHPVHYVPGWDCHGLPIELKAREHKMKELQKSYKQIKKAYKRAVKNGDDVEPIPSFEEYRLKQQIDDPHGIRIYARKFALEAIDNQKSDFMSWGIMGDWETPYRTLDSHFEANQLKVFLKLFNDGYISRGEKPVFWSPSTQTALAEAELEYNQEHVSTAIFVEFPVIKQSLPSNLQSDDEIVSLIWTTTPWTLISNEAISYSKKETYVLVRFSNGKENILYLMAKELIPSIIEKIEGTFSIEKEFSGESLENVRAMHPLPSLQAIRHCEKPFIHGDHVTVQAGSGLVHTAPGHGHEDFAVGNEHGIPVTSPVDFRGAYVKDATLVPEQYHGLSVLSDGNEAIIEELSQCGRLLHQEKIVHSYPYDWRSKKPILIRTTPQWFISIEDLKNLAIESLRDVSIIPEFGRTRLQNTVKSRSEWCISRQRVWGVPIPVFFYEENGEQKMLVNEEIIQHVISIVEKEGSDAWWNRSVEELLPPSYIHDGITYQKSTDTLDVWFDSGTTWKTVVPENEGKQVADLYLEGSDQHRGWFQSSLLTSVAMKNGSPYKTLLTHGFVLDESGRKMSKSLGNVIEPSWVTDKLSADILRLWATSQDFTTDMVIGQKIIDVQKKLYVKIRTISRFIIGLLSDYVPSQENIPKLSLLDRMQLIRLQEFNREIDSYYRDFKFSRINATLTSSISEFSAFYFDIVKDRIYADAKDSESRQAACFVAYLTFHSMVRAIAPVMPHLVEEIYSYCPVIGQNQEPADSFFEKPTWLKDVSTFVSLDDHDIYNSIWKHFLDLRSQINTVSAKARKDGEIGSSLDVIIKLYIPSDHALHDLFPHLEEGVSTLADLCIVSEIELVDTPPTGTYQGECANAIFVVESAPKADYTKCDRCWKYNADASTHLCSRCASIV